MKTLGIVLLVAGLLMTVFTGFTMVSKKNVANVGPLEINKEEKTPIYWSPITGGILAAVGLVIVIVSKRNI